MPPRCRPICWRCPRCRSIRRGARHAVARSAGKNGRVLARRELPHGRTDLSAGQSTARIPAQARAHQAPSARPLGHHAGLNFLYVHLNRLIKEHDLNMIYVIGPGHGGPGLVAHSYLEGSYTERYPNIERNRNGLQRLFRQFSWPYGIPSHVAPETPGSIHEGGELGYSASSMPMARHSTIRI